MSRTGPQGCALMHARARRFALFVRLCRARDFTSVAGRRHQVSMRLMSIIVLAQSHSVAGAQQLRKTIRTPQDCLLTSFHSAC